jgi:hypothetical protein
MGRRQMADRQVKVEIIISKEFLIHIILEILFTEEVK